MTGNIREIAPQPQNLDLIPLHRTTQQIIARGRHKRIRHKRARRDKAILGWAVVSAGLLALNMVQSVIIYVLQAGPI